MQLLSKAQLRRDFGLTDSLIARLGEPDRLGQIYYDHPAQLYSRQRVEEWVRGHPSEMEAAARRAAIARQSGAERRDRLAAIEEEYGGYVQRQRWRW